MSLFHHNSYSLECHTRLYNDVIASVSILEPSGCPLDFHINATSSHNISVSWDEVPVDERNGPITSYVIAAYRVRGGEQRLFQRKSSPSVLSGFSPNTEYEIMIVAVNEIGLGPSSCPMQYVTTMEDSK